MSSMWQTGHNWLTDIFICKPQLLTLYLCLIVRMCMLKIYIVGKYICTNHSLREGKYLKYSNILNCFIGYNFHFKSSDYEF